MATLSFDFAWDSTAVPAAPLGDDVLTGAAAPTVSISKKAFADGALTAVVSGGALVYDATTKTFGYMLADATPTTHRYIAAATTNYATASQSTVRAIGIVIPDALVSSLPTAAANATAARTQMDDALLDYDVAKVGDAMTLARRA
jgi:hypothetical protein